MGLQLPRRGPGEVHDREGHLSFHFSTDGGLETGRRFPFNAEGAENRRVSQRVFPTSLRSSAVSSAPSALRVSLRDPNAAPAPAPSTSSPASPPSAGSSGRSTAG